LLIYYRKNRFVTTKIPLVRKSAKAIDFRTRKAYNEHKEGKRHHENMHKDPDSDGKRDCARDHPIQRQVIRAVQGPQGVIQTGASAIAGAFSLGGAAWLFVGRILPVNVRNL
jgi:hypothetical protein